MRGKIILCNYSAKQPGEPGLYFKSNKFNTLHILLLESVQPESKIIAGL